MIFLILQFILFCNCQLLLNIEFDHERFTQSVLTEKAHGLPVTLYNNAKLLHDEEPLDHVLELRSTLESPIPYAGISDEKLKQKFAFFPSSIGVTNTMSICLWAKFSNDAKLADRQILVSKSTGLGSSPNRGFIFMFDNNGFLAFEAATAGNTVYRAVSLRNTFAKMKWYHVCVTVDVQGSGQRLFVDAQAERLGAASDALPAAIQNTVAPLEIGRYFFANLNQWSFTGRLAEVMVLQNALSVEELNAIYRHKSLSLPPASLNTATTTTKTIPTTTTTTSSSSSLSSTTTTTATKIALPSSTTSIATTPSDMKTSDTVTTLNNSSTSTSNSQTTDSLLDTRPLIVFSSSSTPAASSSLWVWLGPVLGVVAVLALLAVIVALMLKKRGNKSSHSSSTPLTANTVVNHPSTSTASHNVYASTNLPQHSSNTAAYGDSSFSNLI